MIPDLFGMPSALLGLPIRISHSAYTEKVSYEVRRCGTTCRRRKRYKVARVVRQVPQAFMFGDTIICAPEYYAALHNEYRATLKGEFV